MSGLTFEVKSSLNEGAIKSDIEDGLKRAQAPLDAVVLADSNFFIPKKEGILEKSSIIDTRLGSGQVVWTTSYAKTQYYGVNFNHSKQRNPNACAKWFEAAKARWLEKWTRLVNEYVKR